MAAIIQHPNSPERGRERDREGWRQGKPLEDPEKLKRWGFVTARPSEYLVHVRAGSLLRESSGQGATCFKRPWDAVAIVPTSLQQLKFTADQVTAEKVGIEVSGFAVYRIAEPLLAYRVLNFSFPERAQEKLEATLTEMFIGGARRLIANLSVEACLTQRKSALAAELLREVAPVVGGHGALADGTSEGWGVVIDTIEIQEVRILSPQVFASMQAPYRSALDQRANEARVLAATQIAAREAEARQTTEAAKLSTEMAIEAKRQESERMAAEATAALSTRRSELAAQAREVAVAHQARIRQAEAELAVAEAESASQQRLRTIQRARDEAAVELEAHAARAAAFAQHAELSRAQSSLELELEQRVAEGQRVAALGKAEAELAAAAVEVRRAEARALVLRAEKLPELAAAIGQRIGEVRISQFGTGSENPFGSIVQAVSAVLDLVAVPKGRDSGR